MVEGGGQVLSPKLICNPIIQPPRQYGVPGPVWGFRANWERVNGARGGALMGFRF